MKKIVLILMICCSGILISCSAREITSFEFDNIWNEYSKTVFEESFVGPVSIGQREKILQDLANIQKIDYLKLKYYMEKNEKAKYRAVFLTK